MVFLCCLKLLYHSHCPGVNDDRDWQGCHIYPGDARGLANKWLIITSILFSSM